MKLEVWVKKLTCLKHGNKQWVSTATQIDKQKDVVVGIWGWLEDRNPLHSSFEMKNYQPIPPGTLNTFYALVMHTDTA